VQLVSNVPFVLHVPNVPLKKIKPNLKEIRKNLLSVISVSSVVKNKFAKDELLTYLPKG
jgi:hypothetical protein